MAFDLLTGIIVLAIGIVLWAASRAFPNDYVQKGLFYLGLILAIIGIIIIVVAIIQWAFSAGAFFILPSLLL